MGGLSCHCDSDYDFYYQSVDDDYVINKRKKTCHDCLAVINKGDYMMKFYDYEMTEDGDERFLRYWYLCERCADIYNNLTDLNYCISISCSPGEKTMLYCLEQYKNIVKENKIEKENQRQRLIKYVGMWFRLDWYDEREYHHTSLFM